MPTPSSNPERWRRRGPWAALALLMSLAATASWAHETSEEAMPAAPGWRLGGALALVAPSADQRWPAVSLPGAGLQAPNTPADQRDGLRVEHATLDAALRFNGRLGAHLALGWHDRDRAHVEAARALAQWSLGSDTVGVSAGRDTVRMGQVLDSAGHFDTFSQAPLAQRTVIGGQWLDDGISARWQRATDRGLRQVELGLWRGRGFPGGPLGPLMPTLHLHGGWGHGDAHLFVAHLEPQGRGSLLPSVSGTPSHAHGALDCRKSLQQRACFDGQVDVLGASLQWEPADRQWKLSAAGLVRREQGTLYTLNHAADLHSQLSGLWADAHWRLWSNWTLSARLERQVTRNSVAGAGAAPLARDTGLLATAPVQSQSLALTHAFSPTLTLSLEAGRQQQRGQPDQNHLALRLLWREPQWLARAW